MKFKFFTKIFILFLTFNHLSSASPFDIEGGDHDITDGDRNNYEEEIQPEIGQKDNLNKFIDEQKSDEKDKTQNFQELSEVKLKIVNVHNGKRSNLQIKLGDEAIFDGITIKLEKCYKTLDDSYNKISIAYVSLIGSDLKKHSITLSSELALSTVIASKYIVRAECM